MCPSVRSKIEREAGKKINLKIVQNKIKIFKTIWSWLFEIIVLFKNAELNLIHERFLSYFSVSLSNDVMKPPSHLISKHPDLSRKPTEYFKIEVSDNLRKEINYFKKLTTQGKSSYFMGLKIAKSSNLMQLERNQLNLSCFKLVRRVWEIKLAKKWRQLLSC